MTRFILLRHGQTDWNLQRKYQGHADIPLNDTGIQQAFSASEALRNESFDVAFSSDLTRARTTAETVLRYHPRTPLIINSIFRERAFGVLEGTPYQRDLLNPTIRESIDRDPYGHKFDNGGESLLDVYARADEAHRMIRAAYRSNGTRYLPWNVPEPLPGHPERSSDFSAERFRHRQRVPDLCWNGR